MNWRGLNAAERMDKMKVRFTTPMIMVLMLLGGILIAQSAALKQAGDTKTSTGTTLSGRPATILEAAEENKNLTDLTKNVQTCGFEKTLTAKGPMTVFAPRNDAFAACMESEKKNLADSRNLETVLQHHVVPGFALTESDLRRMNGQKLMTSQGEELPIVVENNAVWVGSAKLSGSEVLTSNGVVHEVDDVLMPKQLMSKSDK